MLEEGGLVPLLEQCLLFVAVFLDETIHRHAGHYMAHWRVYGSINSASLSVMYTEERRIYLLKKEKKMS